MATQSPWQANISQQTETNPKKKEREKKIIKLGLTVQCTHGNVSSIQSEIPSTLNLTLIPTTHTCVRHNDSCVCEKIPSVPNRGVVASPLVE